MSPTREDERRPGIAYRLTADDERRIGEAIRGALASWGRRYVPSSAESDALHRIAYHAIGCTMADLRASELDYIGDQIVAEIRAHRRASL